jgi:hypothetical protein
MKFFFGICFDLHTTNIINIPFINSDKPYPKIFVIIVSQAII